MSLSETIGDLAAEHLARTWHRRPEGAPPMTHPQPADLTPDEELEVAEIMAARRRGDRGVTTLPPIGPDAAKGATR